MSNKFFIPQDWKPRESTKDDQFSGLWIFACECCKWVYLAAEKTRECPTHCPECLDHTTTTECPRTCTTCGMSSSQHPVQRGNMYCTHEMVYYDMVGVVSDEMKTTISQKV